MIKRKFQRNFLDSGDFFKNKFWQLTKPTDAHPHPKPTQPIFSTVNFGFLHPPPDIGGSSLGWVQNLTRPDLWIGLPCRQWKEEISGNETFISTFNALHQLNLLYL